MSGYARRDYNGSNEGVTLLVYKSRYIRGQSAMSKHIHNMIGKLVVLGF